VEELMSLNHITDRALLQSRQTVVIPVKTDRVGPRVMLALFQHQSD
jgi:hypothetical protein